MRLFNARLGNVGDGFFFDVFNTNGKRDGLEHPMAVLPAIDFSKCSGVKRRQEILLDLENLTVLSDFAHPAIEETESLRARWPDRETLPVLSPEVIRR